MRNSLGPKLAEGACATVHAWGVDGTQIIKVAKPNTNVFALQHELRNTEIAYALGLPVPRPYELVEDGDFAGIVFERVSGQSLLQLFALHAEAGGNEAVQLVPQDDCLNARLTARLLHRIHQHAAPDASPQRASLARDIGRTPHLSADEKRAVMVLLDQLPQKRQLCHGDANPGNILLGPAGPVVVDWNNATLGNPEADLAEYILMLRYAVPPAGASAPMCRLFDDIRERSVALFVAEYERLSGLGMAAVAPWMAPIAARKLAVDGLSDAERNGLLAEVRRGLDGVPNASGPRSG